MAEDSALAARQHGGEPAGLPPESEVADGIDPPVDDVQAAGPYPPRDGGLVEVQLMTRDDAVLLGCEDRQLGVRDDLGAHTGPESSRLAGSPPAVASGAVSHDLTDAELRVLGCLLEKQRMTPDAYPLTLNALRAACNQSTNRDPVVRYDEGVIRDALARLGHRRWTRLTSYHGSRASKYRHLLDEALGIRPDEQAVLAVLLLRGPQTPGELRQRTDRLHRFDSAEDLDAAIEGLADRDLVVRLERRPGQKESRYAHLLGGEVAEPAAAVVAPGPVPEDGGPRLEDVPLAPPPDSGRDERLARLEAEVAELRAQVQALREELGA
jgi:uncharacterized protein YceH (UPF0502 family)